MEALAGVVVGAAVTLILDLVRRRWNTADAREAWSVERDRWFRDRRLEIGTEVVTIAYQAAFLTRTIPDSPQARSATCDELNELALLGDTLTMRSALLSDGAPTDFLGEAISALIIPVMEGDDEALSRARAGLADVQGALLVHQRQVIRAAR